MHVIDGSTSTRKPAMGVNSAFAALLLGMLMAQMDNNIVVAALPQISADLHIGRAVAGVTASTLLTVTISSPVWGKLGDMIGRRLVFTYSVIVFGLASLLCSLAWTTPVLIGGRALQGLGAGGLIVTAVSAIAQMFDQEQLIRRQIWMTAVFAVSSLAGPPVGGLLSSVAGWQSIFWINLPICVVALALGYPGLPSERQGGSMSSFDYAGTLLIAIGGAAVVGLGASDTIATSPVWGPLFLLLVIAAVALFIRVERTAEQPLIPLRLFKVPALSRAIAATTLVGISLFGTFTFIPLAVLAGTGAPPSRIGWYLLAMTGGQLVIITSFSVLARKYKNMTLWGRLSIAIGVIGLAMLAAVPKLDGVDAKVVALVGLALAGASLGLALQVFTLIGQTSAPRDSIGAAMGAITFTRQLGGTLGAAGFGWLLLIGPGSRDSLTIVLAAAAVILLIGIVLLPGAARPGSEESASRTEAAEASA